MQRRSCLITGASGGIGIALVSAFEAAGWRVISTDRFTSPREAHVVGDISCCADPDDLDGRRIVEALRSLSQGSLQAIVHNAAHQVVCDSSQLRVADWQ